MNPDENLDWVHTYSHLEHLWLKIPSTFRDPSRHYRLSAIFHKQEGHKLTEAVVADTPKKTENDEVTNTNSTESEKLKDFEKFTKKKKREEGDYFLCYPCSDRVYVKEPAKKWYAKFHFQPS